jgi:hypothetical protein
MLFVPLGWLTDPADAGNTRGDNIRSFNDGGGESGNLCVPGAA